MYWDWKQGRPQTQDVNMNDSSLQLTNYQFDHTGVPTLINRVPLDKKGFRLLGVYLSPNGNFSSQLKVMKA